MKIEENKSIRLLKLFEIELLSFSELHSNIDILGRIQLNYYLKKIYGKDKFTYNVFIIIRDEELWEEHFNDPSQLKNFFLSYCNLFGFEFSVLKPPHFFYGDENVFTIPGRDIEKRVSFEYFSSILNPDFEFKNVL
jgi:hypothetical protein